MTLATGFRDARLSLMMACLLAFGAVQAQVSEAIAERLMRDSGIWEQVAELGPELKLGFEQAAQRPPAELGPEAVEGLRRLAAATEGAFSAVSLRLTMRRELAARLDPQQLPALQAWMASAQGRRVTALEVAKSAERADHELRQKAGERALSAATPERRAMLQAFVEVSRNAEAVASHMLNLLIALQTGVARASGRNDVPPLQVLREQLEPQRQKMQEEMAPMALVSAAEMYATLSDAELRAYLGFQGSPAGRHLTEVVIRALDAVVAESAEELGRLVAPR